MTASGPKADMPDLPNLHLLLTRERTSLVGAQPRSHGSGRLSQDEPSIIRSLEKQDGLEVELVTIEQRHVARRDPAKHATTLIAPVRIVCVVGKWPSIANIVEATLKLRMEHDGCGRAARRPDLLLLAHAAVAFSGPCDASY
jgi:hypothetical protein